MLVTEGQARTTMWCPNYRQYQGEDGTGDNRPGSGFNSLCIASQCMGWRWGQPLRETMRNYHDGPAVKPFPGRGVHDYPDGWQYGHTDTDRDGRKFDLLHRLPADDAPRVGYCGEFGKPGEV